MKYCFVLVLFFLTGCALEPQVPTGPTGSVSGYAYLYSSTGTLLPSSAGITVSVNGTNKSAQTNDSGKWTVTGLAAGNYSLTYSKTGFGDVMDFDLKTAGKDTVIEDDEADLSQPAPDQINFQRFTVSLSQLDSIASYNIIGAMEPPFLRIRAAVLCISTDSASLARNPESAPLLLSFSMPGSGYDGGFDWSSTNALTADGKSFPHGATLFATVCISGEGQDGEYLSNYFDPTLGKEVFTSLGRHSQVLTATMP